MGIIFSAKCKLRMPSVFQRKDTITFNTEHIMEKEKYHVLFTKREKQ